MGQSLSASCMAIAAARQQAPASNSPLYSSPTPAYSRMMLAEISFATCNVRYDGQHANPVPIYPGDSLPAIDTSKPWSEVPWSDRRGYLVQALTGSGSLDVIGFQRHADEQEVLHNQIDDLQTLLGSSWDHVGVGRDDGKQAGEYSPIYYDASQWVVLDWATKWLSQTPDVPGSKSWDAGQTRIVTLATLQHRSTAELLHVGNTHYDDRGRTSRAEASKLIRTLMYDWTDQMTAKPVVDADKAGHAPVVLLGDFNSPAEEEGYQTAISHSPLGSPSWTFFDPYTALCNGSSPSTDDGAATASCGPTDTYTSFGPPGSRDMKRIDFTFVATGKLDGSANTTSAVQISGGQSGAQAQAVLGMDPRYGQQAGPVGYGGWRAKRYQVIENVIRQGGKDVEERWSDHRAVKVTIERV